MRGFPFFLGVGVGAAEGSVSEASAGPRRLLPSTALELNTPMAENFYSVLVVPFYSALDTHLPATVQRGAVCHVRVLHRPARGDEVQSDFVFVSPLIQRPAPYPTHTLAARAESRAVHS
jgi:hypothetical protein